MKTSLRSLLMLPMLCTPILGAGCYAEDGAGGPVGQVSVAEPDDNADLVEVSPGVEVIADNDEPIFFADDYYWVNRGGIWYSSSWYRGGWGRAGNPPGRILGISRPEAYAHYRPAGWVGHGTIHGGYASHAQFHTAHPTGGGVRVRAAYHGGGGGHGGGGRGGHR